MSIVFKIHSWHTLDNENGFFFYISGRTEEGKSVCVRIDGFQPFVYVETPHIRNAHEARNLFMKVCSKSRAEKSPPPTGYKFQTKRKLQGNVPGNYILLTFNTLAACKNFGYKIMRSVDPKLRVHEHDIEPIIKFSSVRKLDMSGWVRIEQYVPDDIDTFVNENGDEEIESFSSADISAYVRWDEIFRVELQKAIVTKNLIASFDIECSSVNHNSKIPDASIRGNRIFQIAVTFAYPSDDKENFEAYLLSLYSCPQLKDVYPNSTVLNYKSEEKLLLGFRDLIKRKDPDIVVGWNTHKFDWKYMMQRAEVLGINIRWMQMSRIEGIECTEFEMKWESSAYKKQVMKILDMPGRFALDLQIDVERNYRFDTYSLDNVANQLLKLHKEDVSPRQLFKLVDIAKETHALRRKKNPTQQDVIKARKIVESYIDDENVVDEEGNTNVLYEFRNDVRRMKADELKDILGKSIRYIGVYCVWDTYLPLMIMKGLETLEGLRQMSNITCVPMHYLQVRGQQIKVLAQVYRRTLSNNYVIAFRRKDDKDIIKKYQGATVFEAHPGAYEKVGTLDFASLYPSIIIASNICWSTLIKDENVRDEDCIIVDWLTHYACPHDTDQKENMKKAKAQAKRRGDETDPLSMVLCGESKHRWRKPLYKANGEVEGLGVLPQLLQDLLSERKMVKKKIARHTLTLKFNDGEERDEDEKYAKAIGARIVNKGELEEEEANQMKLQLVVWDKLQLALKISSNSTYGGLGASTSKLFLMEGAACVTARGRQLIKEASQYITNTWDKSRLVYGDSVTPDTPILIRRIDGEIDIIEIQEIVDNEEWKESSPKEKQYSRPRKEIDKVWTDQGWTHVENVMRHRTSKSVYRVLTHIGCVDVTEDHSLLSEAGEKVKPADINIGDKLLHNNNFIYLEDKDLTDISEYKAFEYGLFMSDNSCGKYIPTSRNIKDIIMDYKQFYRGKYKKVPSIILNSSSNIRKAFLEGYCCGENTNEKFFINGKIGAMGIYYILRSLNYNISIDNIKLDTYVITFSMHNSPMSVKKIMKLDTENSNYVYDLTTSNHHFHAGVGSMIVSNTDSTLITFKDSTLKESFELCRAASKLTTHHLKCWLIGIDDNAEMSDSIKTMYTQLPIDLEFENMYSKFIIFTKKKYLATIVDEEGRVKGEQKKGVVLARRDNSHFLKRVYGKCARMALDDESHEKVYDMICEEVMRLFTRQVNSRELVVYKGIQDVDDYDEKTKLPHILLAKRMKERGDEVPPNTKMEYLVLWEYGENKDKLQGDKVEDYTYFRDNYRKLDLKIDYAFYVSNQLAKPIQQLLDIKYPGEKIDAKNLDDLIFGEINKLPLVIQRKIYPIARVIDKISTLKEECELKASSVKDNKKYLKIVEMCKEYETLYSSKNSEKCGKIKEIFGEIYTLPKDTREILNRLREPEKIKYLLENIHDPKYQKLIKACERWNERRIMRARLKGFQMTYGIPHRPHPKKQFIIRDENFMKNLGQYHKSYRNVTNHLKSLIGGPFEIVE